MTDQATRVVAAGWYQDPASDSHVRWWNGLAWTEHVAEKPARRVEPAVAAAAAPSEAEVAEQRIAEARELERQYGISTEENRVIEAAAAQNLNPWTGLTPTSGGASDGSTATGAAWLIALSPLLAAAIAAVGAYVYFYVAPNPLVLLIAAVPVLLTILWAVADARRLRAAGHDAPSPAWSLLGAIGYLIARRARVEGSGPLVVFVLVGALLVAAPLVAWRTGAAAPVTTALSIQQEVRAALLADGAVTAVTCPPVVESLTPGSYYLCEATTPDGGTRSVWLSIENWEGEFSSALAVG